MGKPQAWTGVQVVAPVPNHSLQAGAGFNFGVNNTWEGDGTNPNDSVNLYHEWSYDHLNYQYFSYGAGSGDDFYRTTSTSYCSNYQLQTCWMWVVSAVPNTYYIRARGYNGVQTLFSSYQAVTFYSVGYTIDAAGGTIGLTGTPVDLAIARSILAEGGALTVLGNIVDLSVAVPGSFQIVANGGALNLTGQGALLSAARKLTAVGGAIHLVGSPIILWSNQIVPNPVGYRLYFSNGTDFAEIPFRDLSYRTAPAGGSVAVLAASITDEAAFERLVAIGSGALILYSDGEQVAQTTLTRLQYVEGGRAAIITGEGTPPAGSGSATPAAVMARSHDGGKWRLSLAVPDFSILPGQTINFDGDTFTAGAISFYLSRRLERMEVIEAA